MKKDFENKLDEENEILENTKNDKDEALNQQEDFYEEENLNDE